MGKPLGDIELLMVFGGEFDAEPFPVGRRSFPEIDCDIKNGSADDADQLSLREFFLEMQAA